MSKRRYRPLNPDQMVLSPHAMRDALNERHIVFRIMDVVETLDIMSITKRLEGKAQGRMDVGLPLRQPPETGQFRRLS